MEPSAPPSFSEYWPFPLACWSYVKVKDILGILEDLLSGYGGVLITILIALTKNKQTN